VYNICRFLLLGNYTKASRYNEYLICYYQNDCLCIGLAYSENTNVTTQFGWSLEARYNEFLLFYVSCAVSCALLYIKYVIDYIMGNYNFTCNVFPLTSFLSQKLRASHLGIERRQLQAAVESDS